jgi:hypothetical protein
VFQRLRGSDYVIIAVSAAATMQITQMPATYSANRPRPMNLAMRTFTTVLLATPTRIAQLAAEMIADEPAD